MRARRVSGADRSLRSSLTLLGATLVALAAVAEVLIARGPLGGVYGAYLFPAVGVLYVLTGWIAWARRPANRLGSIMTACGATVIVSAYANTELPVFVAVGAVTATLPLSVLIHLVHACPTGVVRGRASTITVLAAYVAGLILQIPIWAFTPEPPPFDALLVSPRPDLAHAGTVVQQSFGAVVVVVTLWLLARRLREYSTADRRLLAGLLGFALLAVLTVAVGGDVLPSFDLGPEAVADVQLAAVALVPIGFLLVVLGGGFVPPARLAAFAGTITSTAGSPDAGRELDLAVAAALGDPSAVLLRWAGGSYVDRDGRPVELVAGPYRSIVRIDAGDEPLGAVVHDTALDNDPAALAAVTHVAAIALEREQLAREVLASRAELQEASQRVLAAGDATRRRIARNLHDGLQGSLVLLALHARELARDAPDDTTEKAAACLADGVDAAAATLRQLVDEVIPSPLVEGGLAAAVHDLADRLPVIAEVALSPADLVLPVPVETTAYFVLAEAVTNVVKHAGADRVAIRVGLTGADLTLEVVDDGAGATTYTGGSGLDGLRDRLAVLGGTVEVTRLDPGTRVRASLPCGW